MSALAPGTRLGPYEILAPLGAGGMGEVFRARDTRLGREVAIKVLPAAFARDAERVARFRREAQLLAALNHPNIAAIYGLEESEGGALALALELVEGEDLAQRLARGPLPLDEAAAIARQIAEALEEAHERGIVHRDLKPANVKLTADGKAKVLDFGLAKAWAGDPGSSSGVDLSQSPTLAPHGTQAGVILGTAAYMSPEQARGKPVDKRADVWSFGVVLFEMLTGRRLFEGETVSDVLAAVLTRQPNWASLPDATPPRLRRVLERCLERDPKERLRDIGEARVEIARAAAGDVNVTGILSASTMAAASGAAPTRARRPRGPLLGVAVVLLVALAAIAAWALSRRAATTGASRPLTVFGVLVPAQHYLPRSQSPLLDLAADGSSLVFVAEGPQGAQVFLRSFDRLEPRPVAGTAGAEQPSLSPDKRWIAFFAGGQLRKVPVEGGQPVTLAEARSPRGLAWAPDGSLVYAPNFNAPLARVAATGGQPIALTQLDASREERSHRWPSVLPDGKTVLFTVGVASRPGEYDDGRIEAVRIETGERHTILEGARMARYSATGHLVFQRRRTLLAMRFDPKRLERKGEPFTLHEGVGGETSSGAGYFAVSDGGGLAFAPESAIPNERVLVAVDREGRETELLSDPAAYNSPRFSPDGNHLAFSIGSANASDDDVFVYDIAARRTQRLTFGQGHALPLWSPDGRRVLYSNGRKGNTGLAHKAADGSGEESLLYASPNPHLAGGWLPDGRRLGVVDTAANMDIQILDTVAGKLTPLLARPDVAEYGPAFSPDGRFVAYTSTETGIDEVFVETFPTGAGKWQVSDGGGAGPVWSRDGRELYWSADETIVAATVETREVFRAGAPRRLFGGSYELRTMPVRNFDVGPGGRFVLVKRRLLSTVPHELVVIEGWPSLDR